MSEPQKPEAEANEPEEDKTEEGPVLMPIEPEYRNYLRKLAQMEQSSEGIVAANLVRVALIGLVNKTRDDEKRKAQAEKNRIILTTRHSKGKAK